MYHVQYVIDGVFKTVATFNSYDKALYFIGYNHFTRDIDIHLVRICYKGIVITFNEKNIKKVFR